MERVTAVFDQHNRGLFAILALTAFATVIIVASFAVVDADDGDEETCTVDSYDSDIRSHVDPWNVKLKFEPNDPKMGTVAIAEQTVPIKSGGPPVIIVMTGIKDGIGLVITVHITMSIIPLPTWIGFNVATPADGYELDHWTVNGKIGSGKVFKNSTIVAHFKEKTTFP